MVAAATEEEEETSTTEIIPDRLRVERSGRSLKSGIPCAKFGTFCWRISGRGSVSLSPTTLFWMIVHVLCLFIERNF